MSAFAFGSDPGRISISDICSADLSKSTSGSIDIVLEGTRLTGNVIDMFTCDTSKDGKSTGPMKVETTEWIFGSNTLNDKEYSYKYNWPKKRNQSGSSGRMSLSDMLNSKDHLGRIVAARLVSVLEVDGDQVGAHPRVEEVE